jgi:2Fe-2S ferredoxin
MLRLIIKTPHGESRSAEAAEGVSLMQALRDNSFDDLLALCGGCLACGTCHVYIDAQFLTRLPPMQIEEAAMLDSLQYRRPESRLACQIPLERALDGMTMMIAPQE